MLRDSMEVPSIAAVWLRVLVFDGLRWWRLEGMAYPGPDMRWVSSCSVPEALAEVEDAFDATEALCCARRWESSRLRRFTCSIVTNLLPNRPPPRRIPTLASCSFSICMCKSAAVSGWGCLNGPGPGPTPDSACGGCMVGSAAGPGCRCGDGSGGAAANAPLLTALWFEGRMLRDGDDGTGGGGICCDEGRRESASTSGDGGTLLRSGIFSWGFDSADENVENLEESRRWQQRG